MAIAETREVNEQKDLTGTFPGNISGRNLRRRLPSGKTIQQFAKAAKVTGRGNVNVDQLILVAVSGASIAIAAVIVKIGSGSA